MKEVRETPPWSWSVSRRGMFRECPRRYFYHYYAYHNAWLDGAGEIARKTYQLRSLKSLPMLAGEVLHDQFAATLRDVRSGYAVPSAEALYALVRKRMNQAFAESKKRSDWERRPTKLTMLHEMYYGPEPSDARIDALRARLRSGAAGFLGSLSFREAAASPFCEIKGVDHEGHFDLDGTRVYAAPDLHYRTGDGSFAIVDWKTGGEDDGHAVQLGVYGLYLKYRHNVTGPIAGHIEYVADGKREDIRIDPDALAAAEREVRDSLAAMRGYLADETTNRPHEREAFPLRDDRRSCPYCNFWELCRPEIEGGSGPPGPF